MPRVSTGYELVKRVFPIRQPNGGLAGQPNDLQGRGGETNHRQKLRRRKEPRALERSSGGSRKVVWGDCKE